MTDGELERRKDEVRAALKDGGRGEEREWVIGSSGNRQKKTGKEREMREKAPDLVRGLMNG